MVAALTAVVQTSTPPRVLLTASGLTGSTVTLYRVVGGVRTPVRGVSNIPLTAVVVVYDQEAPFGVDVEYEVDTTTGGITSTVASAGPVTLDADLPWLSNPITGTGAEVTIAEWTEWTYAARQTVIEVAGRRSPVVIAGARALPSSTLVLLTRTKDQLDRLRETLAAGDILMVRPLCGAVEEQYVAVGDVVEARVKPTSGLNAVNPAGSDWRRLVTLQVQAVDRPAAAVAAWGDTLGDVAEYVTTDLDDLSNAFGVSASLLTIAQTPVGV